MRKTLLSAICIAFLTLSQAGPGWGQTLGPFQPSEEYREAMRLGSSDRQAAIDLLLQIAADNPRSRLGGESLSFAAYLTEDRNKTTQIYQDMAAEYADTRFELFARHALVNLQFSYTNMEGRAEATDQLIQAFGGPGLAEILAAPDGHTLVAQLQGLSPEVRIGLTPIYADLHAIVSNWQLRYRDGLKLAVFNREAFSTLDKRTAGFFMGEVKNDVRLIKYGSIISYDFVRIDPSVEFIAPAEGDTTGARPTFELRTAVGDFRHSQVDPSGLKVFIDDEEVNPETSLRSQLDPNFVDGGILERLELSIRPVAALSAGEHTVTIRVPTHGYREGDAQGLTTVTRTFVVQSGGGGPLELDTRVVSKHVQPHNKGLAEVEISSSVTPVTYEFSIYRVANRSLPGELGDLVFAQTVQSADGVHNFIWNGFKSDGQRADNGNYDLVVSAVGPSGQQASETVGLQVNFKGKSQASSGSPQSLAYWASALLRPFVGLAKTLVRTGMAALPTELS